MKRTSTMSCLVSLLSAPLFGLGLGCSKGAGTEYPPAAEASGSETPTVQHATVVLQSAPGVELAGEGELTRAPEGVRARIKVQHATPGKHGIHVHGKGDCSDIRGKSMGSHFAPDAKEHGLLQSPVRHLGDLGNIEVAADGGGEVDVTIANATLDAGPRSYVGKALVIHEKEDVGTGPSGDSGDPIACGVIEAGH